MTDRPTMENIREWAREITAFALAVGAGDEKRAEITVLEAYAMMLEAGDGILAITCDRQLPAEVQGVVDMTQLKQAAFGQARSAAMPALHEVREEDGKQWVRFQIPLHLDGLTRNELATAIWEVWKAQELLALQINGLKELEALSTELESLEAEAEPPPQAADPSEAAVLPPGPAPELEPASAPEAPPTETPAPTPRFCSKCGKEAKPQQRFCIGCGTSLEGQG